MNRYRHGKGAEVKIAQSTLIYAHVRRDLVEAGASTQSLLDDINAKVAAYGGVVLANRQFLRRPIEMSWHVDTYLDDYTSAPFEHPDLEWGEAQRRYFGELWGRLAELKAARESGVLVQNRQVSSTGEGAVAAPAATPDSEPGKVTLDPTSDPNAQGRKTAFLEALDPKGDVNPHALNPIPSPYTLSAGSVISASMITGLRSDLPGLVTAQVTENTYDSATGRLLLVPQGARLVGSYDSVVAFGQKRSLIVWQRIIMPDGSSLRIDNVPATDPSGYAGLVDRIDFHTWQLLKGVVLSTLLGVSSELALSGQSDLVQAIRMSTQDNVARAGDQITQRNLGIQPTITIRPGAPVRLVVHRDLVFAPVVTKDN